MYLYFSSSKIHENVILLRSYIFITDCSAKKRYRFNSVIIRVLILVNTGNMQILYRYMYILMYFTLKVASPSITGEFNNFV